MFVVTVCFFLFSPLSYLGLPKNSLVNRVPVFPNYNYCYKPYSCDEVLQWLLFYSVIIFIIKSQCFFFKWE